MAVGGKRKGWAWRGGGGGSEGVGGGGGVGRSRGRRSERRRQAELLDRSGTRRNAASFKRNATFVMDSGAYHLFSQLTQSLFVLR